MKNQKLKIKDLQVKSFVTTIEEKTADTVKGGLLSIGVHCTHAHNGCDGKDTESKCPTKALFCETNGHGPHVPVMT